MGGKKRPTLSQLAKKAEKAQQQQQQAQAKGKKKEEGAAKKAGAQSAFDKLVEALSKEIQSVQAITAYDVASKYGVKMTMAIKALRSLKEKGDLVLVSKGHRTEIYVPARRAAS
ncbi:MAG: 30S ribosomal protein S25e [Thermoproteus sp.]